jgi:hypothetical protein
MTNTWAEGLNPRYTPMDEEQSKLFTTACLLEGRQPGQDDLAALEKSLSEQFFIKVLDKRIEAMKLPIQFSQTGKMAALAFVKVVGAMVVLLIDCLNAYEGKTITTAELADLYPIGFYDEATLERYVDDYMKPRRVKWSDVYLSR